MKNITLSILFGLMSLIGFSQVDVSANFDADVTLPAGWTSDAGDYAISFVENCSGRSVRTNLDDTNTDAHLTSPNEAGLSNGTDLTIAFNYKIVDWSAAVDATPPGWGNLQIQYSTNDGGVWNTLETIDDGNHVPANTCANFSTILPAANVPIGSDFKLRINANWTAGTYYVYLDDISATQEVEGPPSCSNLTTPSNGSTGVSINTNLEWSAATNIPNGYTVIVGTTPGGTDIADNLDVGLSTTYDLPELEYSTTYYVTIIPYNGNGPAVDCEEWSFVTGADPNAPVDCAAGTPINTVYCYENNETITWNFESSDGSPLNVFFNAGQFETCCDDINIYDGTDNTAPLLFGDGLADMTGVSVVANSGTVYIEIQSDGSVSCTANAFVPVDFDVSCVDTTAVPNCNSVLTTPANGATDAGINDVLVWSPASILVTGYTVSVGTTPGGTDIADNQDVGAATTFDPGTLMYETTYYVTIIPYNDNGPAINCNEQTFTTINDPNQVVDCSINEVINTTYCYENNDTMQFFFASSDGSPLFVNFNSGTTENNFDELIVLDSDGVTNLNAATPYGAGGNLTGLQFTSTGSMITIGVTSDGSVISCTGDPWDFDVSCVDTSALPNCDASLTAPLNGAVDVNENDDLNWTPATIFVEGYNLSIGTTPGGTDIVDNLDVGNVTTYDPGTLPFETTIYVTIVPYNVNGSATDCIEESFTIRPDPNQIVDCSINEIINTTYCYQDSDVMQWNFASSDGSQLVVFFNAGQVENNWDEVIVLDSDGTTDLNAATPYGAGGDLTGLFYVSSGSSLTIGITADGIISCANQDYTIWDFDVFCFDETATPNCTSMSTPADGAIEVDINTDITWTPASLLVDGYLVSIGTTPGGTDVADNVDVGDVLTYDPGVLTNATFYYVTIIPYNSNGSPTDCIEESFKTICIPQAVSFNAVGDCDTDPDNPGFVIEVDITDLSGAASLIVSDDQGSPDQEATETGVITMGPYDANTVVTISTVKSDDDTCVTVSSPLTFICPPPPNLCSIVYAGEDASVDCDEETETDLTAVFHLFGQDTNNYVINGLDACPLPSTVGGTPTSLDIDDRWSEIINIGFEFCFFDDVYDQILVGSNGVLSFELENAGGFNGWNMDPGDTLPNGANGTLSQGNIFGVGHDIDPSVCGDINYLVIGSAPYRMFVVNYTNVCHFQCNELQSSSQIILYESSNNIDVNVFDKPTCTTWNDGNAVIGVQNIDDTVAFTPPGRNTSVWNSDGESWRFAPFEDTPSFVFEWFDGATSLGNSETITVSPTETTTYTASVTYDLCTGGTATVTDDVVVTVSGTGGDASFEMTATCDGGTAAITGDEGGTFSFNPEPGDGAVIDPDTGTVTGGTSGATYTVEYTITGECGSTSTQDVTVLDAEDATFEMTGTCDGGTASVSGTEGGTFAFNPEPGDGALIDPSTGTVTGGTSGATYTIEYTTSDSECASTSTQDVTVLDSEDASFTMTATCDGGTATVTGTEGGTFAFNPEPGDGAVIDPSTGTVTGGASSATYTIEYTTSDSECASTSTQDVTVLPAEDASFEMTATCDGGTANVLGTDGGTFAFNPEPGDGALIDPSTGTVTGGASGVTYTIEYTTSDSECASTSTQDVTVLDAEDASFEMTATCDGGTALIVGDAGGTFAFNPEPGDGAVIDPSTGDVTNGNAGATYTIEYTTSGPCAASMSQDVTVLDAEDASFEMTATCDGGTALITGDIGGTFAFNPVPGDEAVIDPSTGDVTNGTSGTTYTIEYTTSGPCSVSMTQDVTVLPAEDASFEMTATCDGGTALITGDAGGSFALNPEPGDGAVIDATTGTITNGASSETYTVEYTTNGDCPATSTQDITVLDAEDASFTMSSVCNEATAEILGDEGGTFAFNPEPGDGAIVDLNTGAITNGTYGSSYTVEYTTSGPCPASSTQTITLDDTSAPDAIAQDIVIQLDDSGNASISVDDINNGSTDDCGIASISIDIDSFTCDNVGDNTVILTVTDVGGNVSTASSTVTVEDNVNPVAECNDITVDLDSSGNYTLTAEDIDAIGLGSSDACGIQSMSVSQDSFTCDSIGNNTITLTVTDVNGNESTCEVNITVDGVIPTVSITETSLSEFCQGAVLTAEGDNIVSFEWTTGEDTASITVLENGTYGVTVTSVTNCTAYVEYTVTSIEEGTPISDYTIVASDDVFLHGNNSVESGGVGATSNNGEIKLHQDSHITDFGQAANFTLNHGSTIADEINEPANPIIPEFMYNTLSSRDSESVTIGRGETQILDGDVYDVVWVRDGATAIFTQNNISVNRIKTSQNATIEFEGCANVYVNAMFMLAQYGTINANENAVVFYVDNDVHIEKGSNVHAVIYADRQILAKGSNIHSSSPDPTFMTGLFIADKVHGINEVIWNSADICTPCSFDEEEEEEEIENRETNFDAVAWPNPSNTMFNVRLRTLDLTNGAVINVFDMTNKLVHKGEFEHNQVYSFGPELEGGIYIVKITQGKKETFIRLIKY